MPLDTAQAERVTSFVRHAVPKEESAAIAAAISYLRAAPPSNAPFIEHCCFTRPASTTY